MEVANLPSFLKLDNAEKTQIGRLCCLTKGASHKVC